MLKYLRFFAATLGALALVSCNDTQPVRQIRTDGYSAVMLDNGAVYFGQLKGLGTDYPVLTKVFYVQTVTNAETRQTTNILVKRGKEWHAPDHMTLNARHIVLVEPVTAGSQVSNLIEQAK